MVLYKFVSDAFHLLFPHTCTGCGNDLLSKSQILCIRCISELPHTGFAEYADNAIEKIFAGRLKVSAGHSEFFFSKHKLVQRLIHQLKYKSNLEIGIYLGSLVGDSILRSGRFQHIDYLIPLPLYPDKEFKRGYNQAEVVCRGIKEATMIPILHNIVTRKRETETQTRKHRAERWENVQGSFEVADHQVLQGKHLLLVDDVLTTGATIEACGQTILQAHAASVSIAVIAHAST